jgi:putative redox protein
MYRAQITHAKDLAFSVELGDFGFVIDAKGIGASPLNVLLASLGSCIGVFIRKYAEGSKLPLDNFSVTVEAELAKEPPMCFRTINVAVDLKETKIDDRRKQALLEFIKNCPVHNTLKADPRIEVKIR